MFLIIWEFNPSRLVLLTGQKKIPEVLEPGIPT